MPETRIENTVENKTAKACERLFLNKEKEIENR
jgi:hypothetical protein